MDTRLSHLDDLPVVVGEGALFGGRHERQLAKSLGLTQFGVNHVTLAPGSRTASRHWHEAEDEFVYVIEGTPTLVDDNGRHNLVPGSIVGWPAGEPNAHHILNETTVPVVMIVVGSRRPGHETIHYPDDDFGPIHK